MSNTKFVYIFGPYTADTPEQVSKNIIEAREVGQQVTKKGYFPIIPHSNTAHFDSKLPEIPPKFWLDGYLELIRELRPVALVGVPGWEKSQGSIAEVQLANKLGIRVYAGNDQLPDANKEPLEWDECPRCGVVGCHCWSE